MGDGYKRQRLIDGYVSVDYGYHSSDEADEWGVDGADTLGDDERRFIEDAERRYTQQLAAQPSSQTSIGRSSNAKDSLALPPTSTNARSPSGRCSNFKPFVGDSSSRSELPQLQKLSLELQTKEGEAHMLRSKNASLEAENAALKALFQEAEKQRAEFTTKITNDYESKISETASKLVLEQNEIRNFRTWNRGLNVHRNLESQGTKGRASLQSQYFSARQTISCEVDQENPPGPPEKLDESSTEPTAFFQPPHPRLSGISDELLATVKEMASTDLSLGNPKQMPVESAAPGGDVTPVVDRMYGSRTRRNLRLALLTLKILYHGAMVDCDVIGGRVVDMLHFLSSKRLTQTCAKNFEEMREEASIYGLNWILTCYTNLDERPAIVSNIRKLFSLGFSAVSPATRRLWARVLAVLISEADDDATAHKVVGAYGRDQTGENEIRGDSRGQWSLAAFNPLDEPELLLALPLPLLADVLTPSRMPYVLEKLGQRNRAALFLLNRVLADCGTASALDLDLDRLIIELERYSRVSVATSDSQLARKMVGRMIKTQFDMNGSQLVHGGISDIVRLV